MDRRGKALGCTRSKQDRRPPMRSPSRSLYATMDQFSWPTTPFACAPSSTSLSKSTCSWALPSPGVFTTIQGESPRPALSLGPRAASLRRGTPLPRTRARAAASFVPGLQRLMHSSPECAQWARTQDNLYLALQQRPVVGSYTHAFIRTRASNLRNSFRTGNSFAHDPLSPRRGEVRLLKTARLEAPNCTGLKNY